MPRRSVVAVPVHDGPRALELLPVLAAALAGEGPAALLVPAAQPAVARELAASLAAGEPLAAGEDSADDPTAVVIATSGSTGQAKGVLLPAGALTASARATHARLGGPGDWLLATSARYVGGLQVLWRSLLAGRRPAAMDLAGGFRPQAFADAARPVLAADGPRYTAMVPTQAARLIEAGGAGLAALRAFDAVVLGGSAASAALLARAAEAGVRLVPSYGMSETASGCVYAGVPLDGVRVRLDEVGRVSLAGPMLARGYRGRPADTAEAFADGWFRTGDLGRLDQAGGLEVLGRADDLINTGGVKVAPVLVERVLAAQPGVREACVLGVPDPEWGQAVVAAVVPVDGGAPPAEAALREAVRAAVGRAAAPKVVRFLPALPLRGPGKPDRIALRALFD
ncbi:AMP-binding protein [Solihabitans fulvus]|uniref:AMP-binding protein n=1 Tax=Solihabitans fulvus TaxID=1892852 RepID=A0A5B2XPD4_9PSEU|nr:o-succinylbenzoate--CoA ligase [Solihabitans fulvus]KAA2264820.1 AMP-binding protein [Solihabitans fulvus]